MNDLQAFVSRIDDFFDLSTSGKIIYFSYYLLFEKKEQFILSKNLQKCYEELHLNPYSKINYYLSEKSKGKHRHFIKLKDGYKLEKNAIDSIANKLGIVKIKISDQYFPLSILDNTRGYIIKTANQACACYDTGLFDACLAMTRKLIETLIIEIFERHNLSNIIKKNDGNFYFLSELIELLLKDKTFNISRNSQQSLSKIKKYADMSAHNRRFNANKSDIDSYKEDLRVVLEEFVHLIDHSTWNDSK